MRVLWIGPDYSKRFNFHHESLPLAVARQATEFIRWTDPRGDINEIVRKSGLEPDVVVVQHPRHCQALYGFESLKIPKIAVLVDYFPRNYILKNDLLTRGNFDIAFFPERYMVRKANEFRKQNKIPRQTRLEWLPFWCDIRVFQRDRSIARYWDVLVLYSGNTGGETGYINREAVVAEIEKMKDIKAFLRILYSNEGKVVLSIFLELLNLAKIGVTSIDVYGSVNLKHFEYPACGTLLITDEPEDFEDLGFKPGTHYVRYSEVKELPELIRFYLRKPYEAALIARKGNDFVRQCHNVDARASALLSTIRYHLGE